MIAVIFEAKVSPSQQDRYLELAALLRPELSHINGFIDIERFQSLTTEGKVLSLSWWENEDAVLEWKHNLRHLAAQREGQQSIFAHYRIRVAEVMRDYTASEKRGSHV